MPNGRSRGRTLHCGGAPQDTGDRVGRSVRHTLGRVWVAHGRVGARPESVLVDHDTGVERPGIGHVRDLLVRAAHSNPAGSNTHRADDASRGGFGWAPTARGPGAGGPTGASATRSPCCRM